jgi:dipeptidyl aminopeptidase/acylaminoacyl peptidase
MLFGACSWLFLVAGVCAAEELKTLGIEEYLGRETVGSPVLSPDGRTAVFTVGTKDDWDGQRSTSLWLISTDGGAPRQLTNPVASDWDPRWSPDGTRIAFVSTRTEVPQVFAISLAGGEARLVTDTERGVDHFRWIDNGTLAFVTAEPRDEALVAAEEEAGGGFVVGTTATTSALWRQSIDDPKTAERLTDGSYFIDGIAVAPGGTHYALVTSPSSELYDFLTEGELRLVDRNGATLRVEQPGSALSDPEFSPDGSAFSVVASTIGFSIGDGLFVFDLDQSGGRNLTFDLDPTILESGWIDDETIGITTLRGTTSSVVAVPVGDSSPKTLLEPGLVFFGHSGPGPDGRMVFTASHGDRPTALMIHRAGEPVDDAKELYQPNPWLEERTLATTETIRYTSFDGVEIEAVLTLPVAPHPSKNAPLLVMPHGGPDGMSLDDFSFLPQIFAAQGLMVFEPNFRGGIGAGRELYAANRGRIGDVDYRDIMAGVDHLVETGRADSERLLVGGWSFGGTITNWIIGHTDRFRAAVSVAGVSNYVSRYGTSDVNHGEPARWEFGRLLTEDHEFFIRSSPISHLEGSSTPTLLMHGEEDRRVPVGQAQEMYRALRELGVETNLVLYPGAGHGIGDPRQFRDVVRRWIDWYLGHLPD